MSPTWAPGLAGIDDKGFGGSRAGDTVDGIVLHHTANGGGASALGYVANANSRNSHPTYLVQANGNAYGIVNPVRRPYSTANSIDYQCVSFETDNSEGAPNWTISDASLEKIAQITLHHYRESNRYGQGIARNIPGVKQKEFFVAWHNQYIATTCPGPSMINHLDWIINRVMELDKPPVVVPPVVSNVDVSVGAIVGVPNSFAVYGNARDAAASSSVRSTYPAGNYTVFKVIGDAVNLTRKPGTPGGWAIMSKIGLTPPVVTPPVVTPPVITPPVVTPPVKVPPVTKPPIEYHLPDTTVNADGSVNIPLPDGTNVNVSDIPIINIPMTKATKAHIAGIATGILTVLETTAQVIPDSQTRMYVMLAAGVITVAATWFGVYVVPNLPKITRK
jgi:hypothetical protein